MFHSGLPDRYEAIKFGNDRVSKIKKRRRKKEERKGERGGYGGSRRERINSSSGGLRFVDRNDCMKYGDEKNCSNSRKFETLYNFKKGIELYQVWRREKLFKFMKVGNFV